MPADFYSLFINYLQSLGATKFWLYLALLILLAMLCGFLLGLVLKILATSKLRQQLELNSQLNAKEIATLEFAKSELENHFAKLSQAALQANSNNFLNLAKQSFNQELQRQQLSAKLGQQAIASLVEPIKAALGNSDAQLRAIEKERQSDLGSLRQQLAELAKSQGQLQGETRNLVNALRRPEVRGLWGELTLKRLAELSGMVEFCDFFEQQNVASETGNLRPDMLVQMPDQRTLVVDAKTPLDAYLRAVQASDDASSRHELQRHAQAMRQRVRELAQKQYWQQFSNTPDFVILFIPGEQFLSAALEVDNDLLEYALGKQVILATPNSLVALLRAVAFGWRQQSLAENAEKIRSLGEDLYSRIATFSEHIGKIGGALQRANESYNKAVGSLERNVLPAARRFVDLGLEQRKPINEIKTVDNQIRQLSDD